MSLGDESDVSLADPDLGKGHIWLRERVPLLEAELERRVGCRIRRVEVYRPELRQMWLYGAGRSVPDVVRRGIPEHFARPAEARVTNAWSARVSAHGLTIRGPAGTWIPAAAAIDCGPLGVDGRLWTRDDPWDAFVATMAAIGPSFGLVHFHSPGKQVWDRPHLELLEWSNHEHRLTDRKDASD